MTTDILPYWDAVVLPVVKAAASRYAGYLEQDDLGQEAAVWWYQDSSQKHLPAYLEEEGFTRLRRSLWRALAKVGEIERSARVGYEPHDQVTYRPADVDKILPLALDPMGIPDGGGVPDITGIRAHGNLAEGGDVLASLLDVRAAIRSLTSGDEGFLRNVEQHRRDWDAVAELTGTLPDSVRRRHARIVERLARSLNNEIED